jgi:diacylglycerol kinase family enzyme
LSGRRRLKVATDGEVCKMALPLRFQVLEGSLALLVPEDEQGQGDGDASRPARAASA